MREAQQFPAQNPIHPRRSNIMATKEKYATESRPATMRELHLLENVWSGKRRHATHDQRILGNWSQKQLEKSLDKKIT
jgi:hypothetical protein